MIIRLMHTEVWTVMVTGVGMYSICIFIHNTLQGRLVAVAIYIYSLHIIVLTIISRIRDNASCSTPQREDVKTNISASLK